MGCAGLDHPTIIYVPRKMVLAGDGNGRYCDDRMFPVNPERQQQPKSSKPLHIIHGSVYGIVVISTSPRVRPKSKKYPSISAPALLRTKVTRQQPTVRAAGGVCILGPDGVQSQFLEAPFALFAQEL